MKRMQLIVLAGVLAAGPIAAAADRPQSAPSAASVKILRREWTDTARKRIVPVKIYYPAAAAGPLPVIIFSHGLGGSREGYEYLGRYWAAHGYVSVHLQHKGSDTEVWKGKAEPLKAMRRAAADLRNATNRPLDVRFAIDQIEKMNRDDAARWRRQLVAGQAPRIGMTVEVHKECSDEPNLFVSISRPRNLQLAAGKTHN